MWAFYQSIGETMEPRRGAIAICSAGKTGLITCDEPQEVKYNDGNKGVAWIGIQLTNGTIAGRGGDDGKTFEVKVGEPWSSRTPNVIGYIDDIIGLIGKT